MGSIRLLFFATLASLTAAAATVSPTLESATSLMLAIR